MDYYSYPKKCKFCERVIDYEKKRNIFCNPACSAKYHNIRRVKKEKKKCINCGTSARNKFCCISCQKNFQYKIFIKDWKSGKIDGAVVGGASSMIKKYLLKKYNNKCQKCGWDETNIYTKKIPLEVEHKDGNYENNKENNLELLCPNCHSLTPTYKGANKGNGRRNKGKKRARHCK